MTPSCCGKQHKDSMQRRELQIKLQGLLFQMNQGSDYMQSVTRTHLIQTSPFSHPVRDASEKAGGEGEEEVEEEERWGQEALF